MDIFGHHIIILNDTEHAIVKGALDAAGVSVKAFAGNEAQALWAEVKAKYPTIVTAIQNGIADAENASLSGGEKAVKVALDVLPAFPAAIQALPDAKAFVVHAVTEVYADAKAASKEAFAALIGHI